MLGPVKSTVNVLVTLCPVFPEASVQFTYQSLSPSGIVLLVIVVETVTDAFVPPIISLIYNVQLAVE